MGYKSNYHRPITGKQDRRMEDKNKRQEEIIEGIFLRLKQPLTRAEIEVYYPIYAGKPILSSSVVRAMANLTYGVENPGDFPAKWRIKPCLVRHDKVIGKYGQIVNRWIHKKYAK